MGPLLGLRRGASQIALSSKGLIPPQLEQQRISVQTSLRLTHCRPNKPPHAVITTLLHTCARVLGYSIILTKRTEPDSAHLKLTHRLPHTQPLRLNYTPRRSQATCQRFMHACMQPANVSCMHACNLPCMHACERL